MLNSYLARYVLLNAVDITDYQLFPAREIKNAPPAFYFTTCEGAASDFETAEYAVPEKPSAESLSQFLARTGTVAFLIIQHDAILYEKYFHGYQRDSIVTSFSISKSFASALVGIAIAEGCVKSLDEPVTHYLPELKGDFWQKITLRHLVSMSSGLKHSGEFFPWCDEPKVYYDPDLRKLAEQAQKEEEPGQHFHYNNYNLILLGMVLERVTGGSVSKYLEAKIWQPLGMEFGASWSLDSDKSGMEKMESGVNARAIDFAKFGRLYLRSGDWNGKQIIPAAWVRESTQLDGTEPWKNYKYLWWMVSGGEAQFMAVGNLAQFIFVAPHEDLLILRFGRAGIQDWKRVFPQLFKSIVQRARQFDQTDSSEEINEWDRKKSMQPLVS